jgi:hypothetical protein
MLKTAEAFLSGRYNYQERGSSPVLPMVNIEVRDAAGRYLMLLKVEDSPEMIENILRLEGWGITEQNGDNLKLCALDVKEIDAPAPVSLVKEDKVPSGAKRKKSHKVEILVLVFLIVAIFCGVFALGNIDPTEQEPDVGNPLVAEAECHKAVRAELANNNALINNSQVVNDTRFPTHYQVVGFAETSKESGQPRGKSFTCDMNYSPELKKWDVKVSLAGGK